MGRLTFLLMLLFIVISGCGKNKKEPEGKSINELSPIVITPSPETIKNSDGKVNFLYCLVVGGRVEYCTDERDVCERTVRTCEHCIEYDDITICDTGYSYD